MPTSPEDTVDNPLHDLYGDLQGGSVPIPLDDFDWASDQSHPSPQMVCRAASSTARVFDLQDGWSAGEHMQRHHTVELFQDPREHGKDEGEFTLHTEKPNNLSCQPEPHSFDSVHHDTTGTTQVGQQSL